MLLRDTRESREAVGENRQLREKVNISFIRHESILAGESHLSWIRESLLEAHLGIEHVGQALQVVVWFGLKQNLYGLVLAFL